MKKDIFVFAVLYFVFCAFFVQSQNKSQFPILAWYSIPANETTVARYQEMRNAGITHSYTPFPNIESMQKALDVAQKTGIKMMISCPELKTNTEQTVLFFKNHPALAGYMLTDEPTRSDFPELGDWVRRIRTLDDNHFCYINLFHNHAYLGRGTKTYEEYVNLFVKEVPVQLLTFDDYPIMGDSVRADWYDNLETISRTASESTKPFWAFALTVAHGKYPLPTMEQLRLQVFSNLAYGAQGIQYFTYWTPEPTSEWDFNNGPITSDGSKSVVYERIKEMSNEINSLADVFLGAEIISVKHTGKEIPLSTKRLLNLPPPIELLKTEGLGAVVSVLENHGNTYLVVVNRDFKNSMKLNLEASKEIKQIFKYSSPKSLISVTINIEPGNLAIFSWKGNQK